MAGDGSKSTDSSVLGEEFLKKINFNMMSSFYSYIYVIITHPSIDFIGYFTSRGINLRTVITQ